MDVTVIIVNYNVEHFLSQCLQSVRQGQLALTREGFSAEIIVVDNHSVDGSCSMVRRQFPEVKLMELKENLGFAKANNAAIEQARGRWILLLNPDTLVQENTLLKCLQFADSHERLGGMGVPMVDGNGRFLPESKRGIPTPSAAFWKISGLYRLAPRSAVFNRYYMGHLSPEASNQIEILSGAFMWMRKAAIDQVGALDEQYFMYGEDIDLSWRLIKGGWENHFFAETSIIHYKGESTKKGSLNYVLVFYRAMQIFARTHFSGPGGRVMHSVIQLAIYLRAALAVASRIWKALWLPLVEGALIWGSLVFFLQQYGSWKSIVYDWELAGPATLAYTLAWLAALKFQGGYDRPWTLSAAVRGVAVGSLILLSTYALLPEHLRFSRAIFVFGTGAVLAILGMTRGVWTWVRGNRQELHPNRLFISEPGDLEAMRDLVRTMDVLSPVSFGRIYALSPSKHVGDDEGDDVTWLGGLDALEEAIRVHRFKEVIMSGREVKAADMIQAMSSVKWHDVRFRIAWTDDGQIVGAGGPERGGIAELQGAIFQPHARRTKRLLDVVVSVIVLVFFPLFVLTRRGGWVGCALEVLMGQRAWVGFDSGLRKVPQATQSFVWNRLEGLDDRAAQRVLLTYVRDYRWTIDLQVIWEALISHRAIHRHGNN